MLDFATRVHNHNYRLDPIIRSLLDTDFYKFLMHQFIWMLYPDVPVTLSLINRTAGVRLAELIPEATLRAQLDYARDLHFQENELIWLAGNRFYGRRDIFRPEYIEYLRAHDPKTARPYTARYVGSMVADVHRTLLQGGVFLYPGEVGADGRAAGKLRLQYEAAPMALILEHAGGRASTGKERILDIRPDGPHQRVPLVIGSPEDVALFEEFLAGRH